MSANIRFYMEQSVPELEDLKRKGLFEQKEITMIMRRRTDFEHRISGRGTKPRDFLRYADFEMNLEKLRIKRRERLRKSETVDLKPSVSDWAGFRKIIFIFNRAVRKYPGDLDIWTKYLQFVKEKDAIKIVYKVYAKLLSLQPRNVDAWLSAAKYEFEENANAKGARELYQRALKFNPESSRLWLSYAQFELTYVTKLLTRRKVMGLLTEKQQQQDLQSQAAELQSRVDKSYSEGIEENSDMIALDDDEEEELKNKLTSLPEADMNVLGNPESNPVLKGDIALAVFDLSIPELVKDVPQDSREKVVFEIASQFLSLFDKFAVLDRAYLAYHIVTYLQINYGHNLQTVFLDVTLPLRTVKVTDADFAEKLQLSVNKFLAYKSKTKNAAEKQKLVSDYVAYLNEFVGTGESEKTGALLKAIIQKCR